LCTDAVADSHADRIANAISDERRHGEADQFSDACAFAGADD